MIEKLGDLGFGNQKLIPNSLITKYFINQRYFLIFESKNNLMVLTKNISTLPTTLEEFMVWESEDGFKYEWNDGDLIKFVGMNRKQIFIYEVLNQLFIEKGL